MTRINVGIPPRNLTDQHLLAEHREIKRLCAMFANFKDFDNIPLKFTLGTGHMKFFMNKGRYAYYRYHELYAECLNRNFRVEYYSNNWKPWSVTDKFNNYTATDADRKLIIDRIKERILNSNQTPRYYGIIFTKEQAIKLLTND